MRPIFHNIPGFKIRSISKEITLSLISLLILVEGLLMLIIYYQQSSFLIDELNRKAENYSVNLGKVLIVPIWEYNTEQISKIGSGYMENELIHELKVTDIMGEVLYYAQKNRSPGKQFSRIIDIHFRGKIIGKAELTLSMDKYSDELSRLKNSIFLIFSVSLIVIMIATGFLLRILISRPLGILKKGIDGIADGDYSQKLDDIRHNELTGIAERFNEMAARIKNREILLKNEVEDRKAAQEKLKKSEARYRILFESSSDAILIMQNDIIVDCNHKAMELFGHKRDGMIGNKPYILSPEVQPDQKRSEPEAMAKINQAVSGKPQLFEWCHQKQDGTLFDAEVSLTAIELESSVYIQAIVRDISERKRTQEIMVQTEKMMSVGGLAAGMAHEINNPLAGILQNAQVMINRLDSRMEKNRITAEECGTTIEAVNEYTIRRGIGRMLDSIVESGKRAAKIVDNMLSFSRKSDLQFMPTDLKQLLDNTLEIAATDYDLKKKYDFRRIGIIREYAADMPDVMCHQSQIQQVLLNILNNGAQSMAECNREKGKQSVFILRLQHDARWATVEIEDNGPGMKEDQQKRIFEPFFTTKSPKEGTGLGLSVSYFIITENHKGTLTVESEPGKGTRFTIKLPCSGKS
ncbi:MAG: ATP-binding protein [Pseudomonadota bacterium]